MTSDRHFFERLAPVEQRRFFEESYKIFATCYGEQNIAYATVHHDEKTPHLHLGVVPMRDGKLQGKNVFNRQELLWLQDEFPKHMSRLGFDLVRGEKGSAREHMETAKFKKHILEKEIAVKKNELLALNEEVPDDIQISVNREMGHVIVREEDFEKILTAAKENERLKNNIKVYLQTDIAKENVKINAMLAEVKRENGKLQREITQITEEKNALGEENERLQAQNADLMLEIAFVYENIKAFVKERTSDFRGVLRAFADKVKDKLPKSQFGCLQDADEREAN